MESQSTTTPTLETPCEECHGEKGYWSYDDRYFRCPHCNGSGFEPTELGERILALMRHNFKTMLEDAQD